MRICVKYITLRPKIFFNFSLRIVPNSILQIFSLTTYIACHIYQMTFFVMAPFNNLALSVLRIFMGKWNVTLKRTTSLYSKTFDGSTRNFPFVWLKFLPIQFAICRFSWVFLISLALSRKIVREDSSISWSASENLFLLLKSLITVWFWNVIL